MSGSSSTVWLVGIWGWPWGTNLVLYDMVLVHGISTFLVYFQMTYGLLLYFKLARVVMGNVRKKGEKYEKYY